MEKIDKLNSLLNNTENIKNGVDDVCKNIRQILITRFNKNLPEVKLYAAEDTKILLETIETALSRVDGEKSLIDVCTGDSIVPSQLLSEGKIKQFWGLDINTSKAESFQEKFNNNAAKIIKIDILNAYKENIIY